MLEVLVARLADVREAAFDPGARSSTPVRERLCAEIERCFDAWERADAVPLAAVEAAVATLDVALQALPDDVRREHVMWKYQKMPRDGVRRGEWNAGLSVVEVARGRLAELRHRDAVRRHPGRCDCAAMLDIRQYRRPTTPSLVEVGPSTDRYFLGECFECGACKQRWNRLVSDDDTGGTFWEPST